MKTTTMLLIAAGVAGGYYLYTKSKPQTTTVLGGGTDGTQSVTVSVDGNMSAADITAMQTAWNAAMTNNDLTAANTVITNLKSASHPTAAASLQTILTAAATAATAAQGYSAGAIGLRRINMLPSLGHLPPAQRLPVVHKLLMVGHIR